MLSDKKLGQFLEQAEARLQKEKRPPHHGSRYAAVG